MNNNYLVLGIAIFLIIASGLGYYLTENGSIFGKGNINITDMANRTVTISSPVSSVLTTDPTTMMLVYMLDPNKLLAFNYQMTPEELSYIPDKYKNLPSVGGWYGGQSGSYEEFIEMEPDLIFMSVTPQDSATQHEASLSTLQGMQQKFGTIPVVGVVDTSNITSLDPSILFMGNIMGSEAKANQLVAFNDKLQNQVTAVVSTIPEDQRVTVYYAEDTDGLQTEPPGSVHAQLIDFCGGRNVADVQMNGQNGQTDVSMEQVLKWNPEVIITTDPTFYSNVYNNSEWSTISAVKNKKVYLSPQSPFKWFDRPTGANMIIGIPWVAKILYPDKFKNLDLVSEVKEFYSDFYNYQLSDNDANNILKSSGM